MTTNISPTQTDQAAQDDAHLRSLGISPQLKRSLGFLSNFAVAFSYISVSTGTYTLIGLGLFVGGPPFFWSWPLVVFGQLFVAVNFAELASHFPVAGSIYQWSKRLSHRTLGWFTGWFYFWAGVITVTAVAATVPLVLSSILGVDGTQTYGPFTWSVWVALVILVITTIINAFGVRLLSIINNIGVAAEIVGMLVFGLILLIFYNHQPLSVLTDTFGTESQTSGNYLPVFAIAAFMSLFVVYGFDTAGTFGEETVGASRHAPRGILSAILLSGFIGAIFLLAVILATPDIQAEMTAASKGASPIADAIVGSMGTFLGNIYLSVILAAVFVCTLAIQGATTRLMFSMGRDGRLPFGGLWGHVSPSFKTPANSAVAVGILAAIPLVVSSSAGVIAIAATGTIYLSYFLCNLGVLVARTRGWPRTRSAFNLGGWGLVINVIGLIYGGIMLINFALWQNPAFGDWGTALRANTNPTIDTLSIFGVSLSGLPQLPLFETFLAIVLVVGIAYYAVALRGRVDTAPAADFATGEAAIA
ncbi:MAG: amino acid permease [Candidatus Limnocylindrales bacterium]